MTPPEYAVLSDSAFSRSAPLLRGKTGSFPSVKNRGSYVFSSPNARGAGK
eukprot:IDg7509t1